MPIFSSLAPGFTILDDATSSSVLTVPPGTWRRFLDLQVNLGSLTHQFFTDLDFLLVAPNGANLEFWSDAGGSTTFSNANYTISDSAASVLPAQPVLTPGTYRPSDYGPPETSSNWSGLSPGLIINHPAPTGTAAA